MKQVIVILLSVGLAYLAACRSPASCTDAIGVP